jgi:hypothetical protein
VQSGRMWTSLKSEKIDWTRALLCIFGINFDFNVCRAVLE